ncbi:MAG: hypothetical protein ACLUD2_16810 [Clostridium sp.]
MEQYSVYRDIQCARHRGEIYLGVVGPVAGRKIYRFIKRFMEQMVPPGNTDENQKNRTRDELAPECGKERPS